MSSDTSRPVGQPTHLPRESGSSINEFLYVTLALVLIFIISCFVMYGLRRMCSNQSCKMFSCCMGRYHYDESQNVEVILEANAVLDNIYYAECNLEAGRFSSDHESTRSNSSTHFQREERDGSEVTKSRGSWLGLGKKDVVSSIVIAQEYEVPVGRSRLVQAAPIRVMETFRDLDDYLFSGEEAVRTSGTRSTIISTLPNGNIPGTTTTVSTLDTRDAVSAEYMDRVLSNVYDNDYLIETEMNMLELHQRFLAVSSANEREEGRIVANRIENRTIDHVDSRVDADRPGVRRSNAEEGGLSLSININHDAEEDMSLIGDQPEGGRSPASMSDNHAMVIPYGTGSRSRSRRINMVPGEVQPTLNHSDSGILPHLRCPEDTYNSNFT